MQSIILSRHSYKNTQTLEFNLYHGTSSVFVESIKKYGFGYRDSKIFDSTVFTKLHTAVEKLKDIDDYCMESYLLMNAVIGKHPQYQYKGIYLTPSISQAKGYAENPMGSEYLQLIYDAYSRLSRFDSKSANSIIPEHHPLRKVFSKLGDPILITIENSPLHYLKPASGADIHVFLDQMYEYLWERKGRDGWTDEELIDMGWQQRDFILSGIIPASAIKIEDIAQIR